MDLAIRHELGCVYRPPAAGLALAARVEPPDDAWQTVLAWHVAVEPALAREAAADAFGNRVLRLRGDGPHERVAIVARGRVRTRVDNPYAFAAADGELPLGDEAARAAADPALAALRRDAADPWDGSAEVELFARDAAGGAGAPAFAAARRLAEAIHHFQFRAGVTTVATPPEEVLRRRAGLCQDFATLLAAAARALGLAARYVSGYVYDGPTVGRRAPTTTHAWVEIWFSRLGWRGFDPTNGVLAADTHVRLAAGRWFRDVAPLAGGFAAGGAEQEPFDRTDVRRVGAPEEEP